MNILQDLKEQTRPQHESIESSLDLLRSDLSFDEYIHLLERFYGFYLPVEKLLLAQDSDYDNRQKIPLLAQDLIFFNRELESVPVMPSELLSLNTKEEVLGLLYVIEGSTLGGQVLRQHFQKKFELDEKGISFFTGYGRETGPMWKEFQQKLKNSLQEQGLDQTAIIDSAQKSFQILEHWLTHHHS